MSSIIFKKRECFTINLRKKQKEEIFKINRRPIVCRESMLELMRNKDDESIDKLINISAGSKEMTLNLIDLGGVFYFYDLLKKGKVDEGIMGLGNLGSEKKGEKEILSLDIIDFMLEEVHKYETLA